MFGLFKLKTNNEKVAHSCLDDVKITLSSFRALKDALFMRLVVIVVGAVVMIIVMRWVML